MSTVLCAIDISNEGRDTEVIRMAQKLASLEGAQLDVITVVPDFGMTMVSTFFDKEHQQKVLDEAKARLKRAVVEAIGEEADKHIRHIVAMGKAYEEILHAAKADGADLIVIGSHHPKASDYLLGPNAARVVRHSDCSVHVVRS